MILTGPEILASRERGKLIIDPFDPRRLNPNSYNYRLSTQLICMESDCSGTINELHTNIPSSGLVLQPGRIYLGCTHEVIGSDTYVTTLLGRSSVGRLGLFLNISADLGHCGAISRWTLELTAVQPLRVYPLMIIGQVAFWVQAGERQCYVGRYQRDHRPVGNRDGRLSVRSDRHHQ